MIELKQYWINKFYPIICSFPIELRNLLINDDKEHFPCIASLDNQISIMFGHCYCCGKIYSTTFDLDYKNIEFFCCTLDNVNDWELCNNNNYTKCNDNKLCPLKQDHIILFQNGVHNIIAKLILIYLQENKTCGIIYSEQYRKDVENIYKIIKDNIHICKADITFKEIDENIKKEIIAQGWIYHE